MGLERLQRRIGKSAGKGLERLQGRDREGCRKSIGKNSGIGKG
jgi:hypothetical protein